MTIAQYVHRVRLPERGHCGLRAVGERGNNLLKMTFKALRNISLCPWKIGDIVAAALVILHIEHGRTTRDNHYVQLHTVTRKPSMNK